jgi:hypothetical protein
VSNTLVIPLSALEEYRDAVWHRRGDLRITDEAGAATFLRSVPFCLAFGGYKMDAPTMWVAACGERDPTWPKHSHHDPNIGLVWGLKDTLMQSGVAYYGRLFSKKPSFVARSWLPVVIAAYPETTLSSAALAMTELLERDGPMPTARIGREIGITERKRLTAVIDEAQRVFRIVKTEEQSDPFTYIWGAIGELYATEVEDSKLLSPQVARRKLVRTWLRELGAVTRRKLTSLLGIEAGALDPTLQILIDEGIIRDDVAVEQRTGNHLVDVGVLDTLDVQTR